MPRSVLSPLGSWLFALGYLFLPPGCPGAPPLPSVEFVLQQVAASAGNEKTNAAAFAAHYQYVRWKLEEELDGKGRVIKSSRKVATNSPALARRRFSRNERTVDKHELSLNDDLLRRFTFTLSGRDEIEGRSRLGLDFAPNAAAPSPRNLTERFMQQVAGRVWVDEQTWQVVGLQLHLLDSVKVVGGVVGSVKQLKYAFERSVTPEGWWYTRSVDWEMIGRAVLNRKHIVYHEARTNVVRFPD